MRIPFFGGRRNSVSNRPFKPRKVNATDRHPDQRNYDEVIRDAQGNGETWPSVKWKLVWLADTFVLGFQGIHPRFDSLEAREAWERYTVDPAKEIRVREYQRVCLAGLMTGGNAYAKRVTGGKFMLVGAPLRIQRDPDTNLVTEYVYQKETVQKKDMVHLFVRVRPGQVQGVDLYDCIKEIASEQPGYALALGKLGKLAARLFMFRKRMGGDPFVDPDTEKADITEDVAEIDFEKDNIVDIGPEDEIINPGSTSQPVDPLSMMRFLGTAVAQPYGISPMQLLGDFAATNYSSARAAMATDQGIWWIYQDILLSHTREIYDEWPEKAKYDEFFKGWIIPKSSAHRPEQDRHDEQSLGGDEGQVSSGSGDGG